MTTERRDTPIDPTDPADRTERVAGDATTTGAGSPMPVVYDDRHRLHDPEFELENSRFQQPFEHPARADMIRAALAADPGFSIEPATEFGTEPIAAVHDPGLIEFLATAWAEYQAANPPTHDVIPDVFTTAALTEEMFAPTEPAPVNMRLGWWCFETTTPLTEGTYAAARSSVDVALSAGQHIIDGATAAYGLCRPPGHHAPRAAYGGYCFFNNAAVTAHHLGAITGERISVLDVDYHHGNGTQQIFYRRADVQFVSLHGDPARAFPYLTGHRSETGAGPGADTTTNYPLPVGATDETVSAALTDAIERIDAFDPGVVVVSLGLDMFHGDPISDLALTTDGFGLMGRLIAELGRPVVVLQEGGYATDALGANARSFLSGIRDG